MNFKKGQNDKPISLTTQASRMASPPFSWVCFQLLIKHRNKKPNRMMGGGGEEGWSKIQIIGYPVLFWKPWTTVLCLRELGVLTESPVVASGEIFPTHVHDIQVAVGLATSRLHWSCAYDLMKLT